MINYLNQFTQIRSSIKHNNFWKILRRIFLRIFLNRRHLFNLINVINNLEVEYCQEKAWIIQNYQIVLFKELAKNNIKLKRAPPTLVLNPRKIDKDLIKLQRLSNVFFVKNNS